VEHATVYVSPAILNEFRSACRKKLRVSDDRTAQLIRLLLTKLSLVESPPHPSRSLPPQLPLRDANDRHLLELALAVDAELLLTWDQDLLTLPPIGGLKILTPRTFWHTLR
jgi:putative PIN family toxin of toxin-antitoxin system